MSSRPSETRLVVFLQPSNWPPVNEILRVRFSRFLGRFGRRLTIRTAKFDPKPIDFYAARKNTMTEFQHRENEGPIRIPLHSLSFLFNALGFPNIHSKSLKFRSVVFSIPTAPTKPQ